MINTEALLESLRSDALETTLDPEVSQKLSLYQVFLRLYEQHREMLEEILRLDNSANKSLARVSLPYIQGVTSQQGVYLSTNLLNGTSQILQQPQNIWTLGRDSRRVLIPIQDQRLSRRHAAIRYVEGEGFYLIDLGSSNGTFVNSEPIRQIQRLQDGDRVRMGGISFAFFISQVAQLLPSMSEPLLAQILNIPTPSIAPFRDSLHTPEASSPEPDCTINPLENTVMALRSFS